MRSQKRVSGNQPLFWPQRWKNRLSHSPWLRPSHLVYLLFSQVIIYCGFREREREREREKGVGWLGKGNKLTIRLLILLNVVIYCHETIYFSNHCLNTQLSPLTYIVIYYLLSNTPLT